MAAALRCLIRVSAKEAVAAPGVSRLKILMREVHARNSPRIQDIDLTKLPEYETSSDKEEWKYVERLLRPELVPVPKKVDGPTPAGWSPQREEAYNEPYFVNRNKNYMRPVYLSTSRRGDRQVTVIKKVDGNIWQFERDLREFIEKKLETKHYKTKKFPYVSKLFSRVNELTQQVRFRGDYVSLVNIWMDEKGF